MLRGRFLFSCALIPAALAACTTSPVDEPTGATSSALAGADADTTDKAVVYVAGPSGSCTGTLIAPNLVITNRVCVASSVSNGLDCTTSTIGPSVDPSTVSVSDDDTVTTAPSAPPGSTAVSQILVPDGDRMCGDNVALLVLSAPLASVTPLALRLDSPPVLGEPFTMVGYGQTVGNANDSTLPRASRASSVQCLDSSCPQPFAPGWQFNGGAGPCAGDTGGPAIASDGRVFGVESLFMGFDCSISTYERVDTLGAFLQSGALTAAAAGGYAAPGWATGPLDDAGVSPGGSDGGTDAGGDSEASSDSAGSGSSGSSGSGSGASSSSGSGSGSPGNGGSPADAGSTTSSAPSGSNGGCSVAAAGNGRELAIGAAGYAIIGLAIRRRRARASRRGASS